MRACVAAWLLAALPLYGLGGLAAQVLGPLHVHAPAAAPDVRHLAWTPGRWLATLEQALGHAVEHLRGHSHPTAAVPVDARHGAASAARDDAHSHATARRHRHDSQHADVSTVAEADHEAAPSSASWAWQLLAPGACGLPAPDCVDSGRWPTQIADRIVSRPPDRLERPPRA
jgi:hypothetical protein